MVVGKVSEPKVKELRSVKLRGEERWRDGEDSISIAFNTKALSWY